MSDHNKSSNIIFKTGLAICGIYCLFVLLLLTIGHDQLKYSGDYPVVCGVYSGENAGPLLVNEEIVQTFTPKAEYVTGVELFFQTYARSNKGTVTVALMDLDDQQVLTAEELSMQDLKDSSVKKVSFNGYISLSDISRPAIRVSSNVRDVDSTVTVGIQHPSNSGEMQLSIGGRLVEDAGLAMTVHCTRNSGLFYWYMGLLILGLAVLLVLFGVSFRTVRNGKTTKTTAFVLSFEKYRFLMQQLIARDFKIKYKRSFLGVLWSFLNPLLMMLVQYLVFSNLFRFDIPNYAVYLLSGIVLYSGFSEMTTSAMSSITGNASLITKVYVPKYIYPISKVLSTAINTGLSLIPLLLVSLITGLSLRPALLLLPYGLFCYLVFILGISFALSSFMVYFRDIQFLWGVLTTIWMYATPIIYPLSILPKWLLTLERFNPLYIYIDFLRTVLIDGTVPAPSRFLACLAWALVALAIGGAIFKRTEKKFVLYI